MASKKNIAYLASLFSYILAFAALLVIFRYKGEYVDKVKYIGIAFIILMLYGHYRSYWHFKHPSTSTDEFEKEKINDASSFGEVAQIFFNPLQIRFRTVFSLFFITVLWVLGYRMAAWILLAILIILKLILFISLCKYQKAYSELKVVTGKLDNLKHDTNLIESLASQLPKYKRNAIAFRFGDETNGSSDTGQTKFGGNPDVPDNFVWPKDSEGYPMSFLMQINCSDIEPYDKENLFPKTGLLYFFYSWKNEYMFLDIDEEEEDYDGSNVRIAQAFYFDGPIESLHIQTPPKKLSKEYIMTERSVKFTSKYCLPSWEDAYAMRIITEECTKEEYLVALDMCNNGPVSEEDYNGSLGGYATPVEDSTIDNPNSDILLFQIFSSDLMEGEEGYDPIEFGCEGKIYYYIQQEDLHARNFSNVRFQLND